ncbi:hypothetical protein [Microtetraspora malaysiensis]|uniref:Uncharacterized protein n=1 Tax=Microtetraspora malaysiensis TaxID=161358 RepID=A0ABW6SKB6_9ACTN
MGIYQDQIVELRDRLNREGHNAGTYLGDDGDGPLADHITIYAPGGSLEISPTADGAFTLRLERDPDGDHPTGVSEVLAEELNADQMVQRVREAIAPSESRAAAAVAATGFGFGPVTEESKTAMVAAIRRNRSKVRRGGWPGVPIGWLPVREGPTLRAMVAEGVLELVTVTKRDKLRENRLADYAYVRLAPAPGTVVDESADPPAQS